MVLDLPKKDPFIRPGMATEGDAEVDTLHLCRSRALDLWEHAEMRFALLFAKVVAPKGSGGAARRAYGGVIANPVRRQMIETAAEVFFRNFPDPEAEEALPRIMGFYGTAAGRRNEFAHGIVGGDIIDGKFAHFLVPNTWTSKTRRMDLSIDYRYSSSQIDDIARKFQWLGGQAYQLVELLEKNYLSSSERAQMPY